ncbi:MAG: zf-HC2 domain-containing protein [Actinomycetota bacterium]|nr:zf-HC2 domain-containing protein [Actinomycetota bacterium]
MTAVDPFAYDDAAYVLGALSSDERAAFERHLETCADCAARVREVSAVPALLAGIPASTYGDENEAPPDNLLPHLLNRVRFEQRRRRWVTTGLAGLAAACLVALAVVIWPSSSPSSSAPKPQAMSALVASPVHATAALSSAAWGTKIDLVCEYYTKPTRQVDYTLVIVDRQNVSHPAGTWRLVPGQIAHFTGGTSVARDQISKVQITVGVRPILQLTL